MGTVASFRRMVMPDFRRSCRHKVQFESRGKAEAALRSVQRRELKDWQTMRVYACRFGAHFHLGHQEQD
jgi:hypothetical protein